jgi:hypothetical protein
VSELEEEDEEVVVAVLMDEYRGSVPAAGAAVVAVSGVLRVM